MKKYLSIALFILLLTTAPAARCQVIELQPLFEYPTAPDELTELDAKANYLITNFWRQFDFDQKSVGQAQLNHAFKVYAAAMPWANAKVLDDAVNNLVKSYKKRPGLAYQFAVAADECLYGRNADFWIDEVYLKFLEPLKGLKKIKGSYKKTLLARYEAVSNSLKGHKFPTFEITDTAGVKQKFVPGSPLTLVQFGYPSDADTRLTKLALEIDFAIADMVKYGTLDIWFIVPDSDGGLSSAKDVETNEGWKTGVGNGLSKIVDIRTPSCLYLLDGKGTILMKNESVGVTLAKIKELSGK